MALTGPHVPDEEALKFATSGGKELVAVVPVRSTLGAVTIVSIELYEDGLGVRWIAAPPPETHVQLDVRDELETRYRTAGTGAFGNEHVQRGESLFVPPVPPNSNKLVVRVGGDTLSVDI
jgi:hypothetical protein